MGAWLHVWVCCMAVDVELWLVGYHCELWLVGYHCELWLQNGRACPVVSALFCGSIGKVLGVLCMKLFGFL
jgi:hypothetical protein